MHPSLPTPEGASLTNRVLVKVAFGAALLLSAACSEDVRPAVTSTPGTGSTSKTAPPKDAGGELPIEDAGPPPVCAKPGVAGEIYALSARDLGNTVDIPLCAYRGKVMLVFNGASYCSNTPQYKPLQDLYLQYEPLGLVVLGFPCNQFGSQEPGTAEEISTFCTKEYKITFPMFQKIDVNGPKSHPIYQWLKAQKGGAGDITWNFEKFLIGRNGQLRKRFAPEIQPDAPEVLSELQLALSEP